MSDEADLTSSMIIRPGLKPVWYFIGRGDYHDAMAKGRACHKSTFGAGIKLFERCQPKECCGAIFLSNPDGSISSPDFWRLQWFFQRDEAEALIFEYDIWQKKFFARSELNLRNRKV